MTLCAGDFEMFAVIELAPNQPTVGNDGSSHCRNSVLGLRHLMTISASWKTRRADWSGSGHLRYRPDMGVAEENTPFQFLA